jgi:hypothetical protein
MSETSEMSETSATTVRDPDSALAALRHLAGRAAEASGEDPALHAFLDWLATAARAGALPTGAARAAFVAASAPLLQSITRALEQHVHAAARPFLDEWYGREWTRACEARSRLEYLFELYRGSPAEPALARAADPCDLDDGFHQRGKLEGNLPAQELPPGTPPSHWWWWYPRTPPGA